MGADGWQALNCAEEYSKTVLGSEPFSPSWQQDCSALVDYLVTKEGMNLLETLHLLILSGNNIIQAMSSVLICTTLLKIADTFYSLPPVTFFSENPKENETDESNGASEEIVSSDQPKISRQERRDRLCQSLKEIFMVLFSNKISLNELLVQDQLSRLFGSVTTLCPDYNICWQKLSKQALACISAHCMATELIVYVHEKRLIALYLHNLKHPDMSPSKIVEMFMNLFNLLRDSTRIGNSVLEDFRLAQGYKFISDFALNLEARMSTDPICLEAVKDMLFLISSLTYCGFTDLCPYPIADDDPWQNDSFEIPTPSKVGLSVKNITAFSSLRYIFLNCETEQLSLLILETILGIFRTDNSNYFIVREEKALCLFIEICEQKSDLVQKKLFLMIEFLVSQFNYVPNSELFSICLLLRNNNVGLLVNCLELLIKLCTYNQRMQDVYRFVGILNGFREALKQHVEELVREYESEDEDPILLPMEEENITSDKEQYLFLLFELLRVSFENNNENGKVFRSMGGSRALIDLLSYPSTRRQSLKVLQMLILLEGGQDELGGLLTLISMAIPQAIFIKIDILRSLIRLFSLQPGVKETFRVNGGFLHIMSVLTLLDGCLALPRRPQWVHTDRKDVLNLVRVIFQTFATAMADEPANKFTFMDQIGFVSLADTLSLLGCFSIEHSTLQLMRVDFRTSFAECSEDFEIPRMDSFSSYDAFTSEFTIIPPPKRPLPDESNILACAECFQHLRDFALDIIESKTDSLLLSDYKKRFEGLLNLSDRTIIYPGALISIIKLLPCIPVRDSIPTPEHNILPSYLVCKDIPVQTLNDLSFDASWSLFLQSAAIQEVYCLMNSQTNQQIMCDAGLASTLLKYCASAMAEEMHPLHAPTLRSFEKIAGHQLSIVDLRAFLRLGNPLRCRGHDVFTGIPSDRTTLFKQQFKSLGEDGLLESPGINPSEIPSVLSDFDPPATHQGGPIPLNRMQSLVSISTPRDAGFRKLDCSIPFIEFDLSFDGFAGIFIPSIFPQNGPSNSPNTANQQPLIGGTGTTERMFPSANGFTFCCWLQMINSEDVIKLFTLIRSFITGDKKQDLICFQMEFDCGNKTLFVSTKEILIDRTQTLRRQIGKSNSKGNEANFQLDSYLEPGNWYYIAVSLQRTKMGTKQANLLLYIDGICIQSQKIQYFLQASPISLPHGSSPQTNIHQDNVSGYIGTHFLQRRSSKLIFRLGSVFLFDEPLNQDQITKMFYVNQPYCGNYQCIIPRNSCKKNPNPLDTSLNIHSNADRIFDPIVPEDRIVFGFHPSIFRDSTMVNLSQFYLKTDINYLSVELGLKQTDQATPVCMIPNISQHLIGPSRCVGGVVIGYKGVRIFQPRLISSLLPSLGGTSVLLGLVAMSNTTELLYAAVKIMMYTLTRNRDLEREMDQSGGYQILGMLYKSKVHLLTSHILHMTYGLVGSIETEQGPLNQISLTAFQELLGNISIWSQCSEDVQKSLFLHLYEVIRSDTIAVERLLNRMRTIKLVFSLLQRLLCQKLSAPTIKSVLQLLGVILLTKPNSDDIKTFGLFISNLLTASDSQVDENREVPNLDEMETNKELNDSFSVFGHQFTRQFSLPDETKSQDSPTWGNQGPSLMRRIRIRDMLLDLLCSLLQQSDTKANLACGELIFKSLGFNWVFLFFQKYIHHTTVLRALKLLQLLLLNKTLYQHFFSGHQGGELLKDAAIVPITNTFELVELKTPTLSPKFAQSSNSTWFTEAHSVDMPGFNILQMLLIEFIDFNQIYFVLLSLLLNRNKIQITTLTEFNLEKLDLVFGVENASDVDVINKEASFVILSLCRILLHVDAQINRRNTHAHTIIKFLQNLYNRVPNFAKLCCEQYFIQHLVALLFPLNIQKQAEDSHPGSVDAQESTKERLIENEFVHVTSDKTATTPILDNDFNPNLMTSNPNLLPILKFLEIIIFDSFKEPIHKSSGATILDFVLEGTPNVPQVLAVQFQTSILSRLMDYILMSEVIVYEKDVLNNDFANTVDNIGYLANKLADKLWYKQFSIPSDQIYSFLVQVIEQSKKNKSVNITQVYTALDRVILYQLSRPMFDETDRKKMLESLCLLNSQTAIILSGDNNTGEFYLCLIQCLLELVLSKEYDETHSQDIFNASYLKPAECQSLVQVKEAVERIWNKLLENKRMVLEDIFACQLPIMTKYSLQPQAYSSGQISMPSPQKAKLLDFRSLLSEASKAAWEEYCQRECNRKPEAFSSRKSTKQKKNMTFFSIIKKTVVLSNQVNEDLFLESSRARILEWSQAKVTQLIELQQMYEIKFQKNFEYRLDHALCIWKPINEELTRERGLWGPEEPNPLQKWTQDCLEGPSRQRKRLRVNKGFYQAYEFVPEGENRELKVRSRRPVSYDSMIMHHIANCLGTEAGNLLSLSADAHAFGYTTGETFSTSSNVLTDTKGSELERSQQFKPRAMTYMNFSFLGEGKEHKGPKALDPDNPLNLTIRKMLDPADTGSFQYIYPCARLLGLDTAPGILYLGRVNMYILDGYAISKDGDLVDLKDARADSFVIVTYEETGMMSSKKMFGDIQVHCTKIAYEDVREILKRRFMLRENSMELFCADGNNHFVVLVQSSLNKIIDKIKEQAKAMTDKGEESVVGISKDESAASEGFSLGLFSVSSEKNITNLWEKGTISNFQYLMYLNTLAGRSYNDLMQYPVYPWILADYDSEELDLNDPKTFRDFSKPMGALSSRRLEGYISRRSDYEDPTGDNIDSFLYGTPFSSSMIVAAYLVRMEPFAQHFLKLQGGHFDLADRMFNSIKEAWWSASQMNMPDVKELIPEFFYLPDFLVNHNYFKLGRKQNGIPLNDVILPPWAKGDPHEFIRLHREALESEYVSMHLHEWIDLIFGYKQRGKPAEEAFNVFHPWFYEGNINIEQVTDPIRRNLVIGFIKNYGQMPRQLFKKPHKPRRHITLPLSPNLVHSPVSLQTSIGVSTEVQTQLDQPNTVFYHDFTNFQPPVQPSKELRGPVGQIISLEKSVIAYERGHVILPPNFNHVLSFNSYDHSLRLFSTDQDRLLAVFEDLQLGKINAVASADGKRIFTAGDSSVIHVWEIKQYAFRGKPSLVKKSILSGHIAPITCLTASASYAILLSGSEDCSVIMWDLNHLEFIRQFRAHPSPIAAIAINSLTGDIVTTSGQKLFYWTVNGELLVQGNHFMKLGHRINLIVTTEFCEWDPHNVIITGSTDGVVRIWGIDYTLKPSSRKKLKHLSNSTKNKKRTRSSPVEQKSSPEIQIPELDEENISDVIEPSFVHPEDPESDKVATNESLDEIQIEPLSTSPSPPPESSSPKKDTKSGRERVTAFSENEFTWQRTFVERGTRLTLHTSIHRADNPEPAAITALTISKDYKKLFVGDANGRVWQWTVPETTGGRTDRWVNTRKYDGCSECKSKFTVTDRKHHCRQCGNIFCSRCSKYSTEIPEMRIYKPVRVCLNCYRSVTNQSGDISEDVLSN